MIGEWPYRRFVCILATLQSCPECIELEIPEKEKFRTLPLRTSASLEPSLRSKSSFREMRMSLSGAVSYPKTAIPCAFPPSWTLKRVSISLIRLSISRCGSTPLPRESRLELGSVAWFCNFSVPAPGRGCDAGRLRRTAHLSCWDQMRGLFHR